MQGSVAQIFGVYVTESVSLACSDWASIACIADQSDCRDEAHSDRAAQIWTLSYDEKIIHDYAVRQILLPFAGWAIIPSRRHRSSLWLHEKIRNCWFGKPHISEDLSWLWA